MERSYKTVLYEGQQIIAPAEIVVTAICIAADG